LTEHDGIAEYSVHPSHDGCYVYFAAGTGAWRVDTETFREEELLNFGDVTMREEGMVGAAMGTTAVSHCDRWWAIPVRVGDVSWFVVIDTRTGEHSVICEHESIGHPEFHPDDANLLRFAGPYTERMWIVHRDGTGKRLAYSRDADGKQWIVHETWLPGTRELVTVDWPKGMIGVDIDTGVVRKVTSFNAWHAMVNRTGTLMVADTNFPDIGLQVFDPRDGIGQPRTLCYPESSSIGAHWDTDHCPYDDEDYQQGKWKPYAPQHTHPHPGFSPDGKHVVFTSDRTGWSQVYEVEVPEYDSRRRGESSA
jgi:oligogalacturonide lyase